MKSERKRESMAQFNNGYSSSEILAMQRDAAERVREMQRRAQQRLQQSNGQQMGVNIPHPSPAPHSNRPIGGIPAFSPPAQRQDAPPVNHNANHSSSPTSFGSSIQGLLDQFHLDHDRILLILLFLVLMREDADPTLLLALAYIFF